MMTHIHKLMSLTIINLVVLVLLFLVFEGLSNTILIASKAFGQKTRVAERLHTEYDETLGWINIPNADIENMYGPEIYLRTNGQRFRNTNDFSLKIPNDKARIVCSGDSFTLGYGVDNDHTWCQLLVSIDEQLETVNMGQGGYGIDQAYLWYKRDGSKLDLDVHIFAFITRDFVRMQDDRFLGYGKPILEIHDDNLVTKNVPVTRPSSYRIWFNRVRPIISKFSSTKLVQKLLFEKAPDASQRGDTETSRNVNHDDMQSIEYREQRDDQTRKVALKVFQDLQQIGGIKDSVLVLLYLPTKSDYRGDMADPWREFLHNEAAKHNLLFIDLIDEFQKLPPEAIEGMFIAEGAMEFRGASGHYTQAGNAYVAKALHDKLHEIPEVSERLEP